MSNNVVKNVNTLRQISTNVDSASEAIDIINKLKKELENIPEGVGLAAIQIGIPKRVGVIKTSNSKETKYLYLINTELESRDGEFTYLKEGCLSFPDTFLNTKRYRDYVIKNQRIEDDKLIDETLCFYYESNHINDDGLTSIAVQHEVDHFEGGLIIDSEEDQNIKLEPIHRSDNKVGRNEPCPCGSGKKFKKCCSN